MSMSYTQRQEHIADLKKQADRAYAAYDRASRSMAANDAECSILYHEYIAATDAWKAAKDPLPGSRFNPRGYEGSICGGDPA